MYSSSFNLLKKLTYFKNLYMNIMSLEATILPYFLIPHTVNDNNMANARNEVNFCESASIFICRM
jgi:hypothetical protein